MNNYFFLTEIEDIVFLWQTVSEYLRRDTEYATIKAHMVQGGREEHRHEQTFPCERVKGTTRSFLWLILVSLVKLILRLFSLLFNSIKCKENRSKLTLHIWKTFLLIKLLRLILIDFEIWWVTFLKAFYY